MDLLLYQLTFILIKLFSSSLFCLFILGHSLLVQKGSRCCSWTTLGTEKLQFGSWVQVHLQKRSIQKHVQHKIIFCLVYGPKRKKNLFFAWATAAPGSNSCTAESQTLQQAEGSCPRSSSVLAQHTEGIHHPRVREHQVHHSFITSSSVCWEAPWFVMLCSHLGSPRIWRCLGQGWNSWTGCFSLCWALTTAS